MSRRQRRILPILQRSLRNLRVAAEARPVVVAAVAERPVVRLELRLVAHPVAVKALLQAHPRQAHLVRLRAELRLVVLRAAVKVAVKRVLRRLLLPVLLQQQALPAAAVAERL
jgi:hypothetical protein